MDITGRVPDPAAAPNEAAARKIERALNCMALAPGTAMQDIGLDQVFIGSCTDSRIEDLRAAAAVLSALGGRRIAAHVKAMVVPGSAWLKRQAEAEAEGLDQRFIAARFEWRDAGCPLCVAMNDDRLTSGTRCASSSNRKFEGRQGPGARTHLVSPATAAASAVLGHLADVREFIR